MSKTDDDLLKLVDDFSVAQRRLIEATGGKVDAVVSSTGLVLLPAAQQQLLRSEAQYRLFAEEKAAILDALPAHVALLGPGGKIVAVNKAWREFSNADCLSGDHLEIGADYPAACENATGIDANLAANVARGLRAILQGALAPFSTEYHCGPSHELRWFDLLASPMPQQSGYGAVVMHIDIGDRKRAEAHTREISQRLETLVNEAPVGILVHRDWKMIMANDELAKIFGYADKEEIIALPDLRVLYAPEERARVAKYYDARRQGESVPSHYEAKGRRTDGTSIELEHHAFMLTWGDQTVICAMITEVTEQRSIEAQVRQLQKMEAVGQLTGGIAHDFNNILMVILSNADAVLEESAMSTDTRQRLEQICRAAEGAVGLTSSLLAFSRKLPLRPRLTDINELVVNIGEMLRRTLGGEVEIDSVLADDLWLVNVDVAQLESALVNLCINARDAMPNGGRLLIETTNAERDDAPASLRSEGAEGSFVMLTVTDFGSGIAPELLAKVFEPFFTTKDVGKGTGLGLSMVYGFVKQSGGHVSLYSEVGIGTTVRLYFPRSPDIAGGTVVVAAPAPPRGIERILVVEDDPRVCAAVVEQVRSLGYAVDEATNGEDALAAFDAATLPYDLVLTDVVMPGALSSKALADLVVRRRPQTRILFMSGYSNEAIVHGGRLDPGVHLLSKPFRKMDLAKAIRSRLAGD